MAKGKAAFENPLAGGPVAETARAVLSGAAVGGQVKQGRPARHGEKKLRLNFSLAPAAVEKLRAAAGKTDVPMSRIVEKLLAEKL